MMFSPITEKSLQFYKPSSVLICPTSVSDFGIPEIYIGDYQFCYTITDRAHLRNVSSWLNFNAADNRRGFIKEERVVRRIKTPLKELTCAQFWTNLNQRRPIFLGIVHWLRLTIHVSETGSPGWCWEMAPIVLSPLKLSTLYPCIFSSRFSLPHSQASATCLYPGPAQSSPYTHMPHPGDPSLYYPPIYT